MDLNIIEAMRLKLFIKRNNNKYSQFAQQFWEEEFKIGKEYPYDFVNQVLAYLFPEKCDNSIYRVFIDYMLDRFPNLSGKQIIEVASGYLPALAILLTKAIDVKTSITCFDPKTFDLDIPGIITKKEKFGENTDLRENDILIAHCPCEALDMIVKQTIKYQQELCVQTCPCGHVMNPFMGYRAFDYYIDSLLDQLSSMEDNGFEVSCDYLDNYSQTMAPAIMVRKKTKP